MNNLRLLHKLARRERNRRSTTTRMDDQIWHRQAEPTFCVHLTRGCWSLTEIQPSENAERCAAEIKRTDTLHSWIKDVNYNLAKITRKGNPAISHDSPGGFSIFNSSHIKKRFEMKMILKKKNRRWFPRRYCEFALCILIVPIVTIITEWRRQQQQQWHTQHNMTGLTTTW